MHNEWRCEDFFPEISAVLPFARGIGDSRVLCSTCCLYSPWGVNVRDGAIALSGSPHAKQGGGSLLLLFAVRAARQLAMIHLPTAAGASHPTTYPWDHSASAQAVSGELIPGRRWPL